jgi:methylenetetrahydrofolate dehydrogenase (NADP+)/methenyltetrahydrofolate cyclohydrolase
MIVLNGKPIAEKNYKICQEYIQKNNIKPTLAILCIGSDPASQFYVKSIEKQAKKININTIINNYENISQDDLINKINELNNNDAINGIMIQKPLPSHIDTFTIEQTIKPEKDVDGLHALNAGLLLKEKDCCLPCTAQAILEIIDYYNINPESKHVVIIGRSNVVGKPIANLLLYKEKNRNATITVCHSKTPDLTRFTLQADILITAIGKANMIKNNQIKDGVIIIDAGINETIDDKGNIKYVGDVDYEQCSNKCEMITPVPGGVGSVTTSILLKNNLKMNE